jgi:hypothetical protein
MTIWIRLGSLVEQTRNLGSSLVARSLVSVAVIVLASGCHVDLRDDDHICKPDEYPVRQFGPTGLGQECARKGQEPPTGDVRYPKGQVPDRIGDKWDIYWQDHALDSDGKTIPLDPDLRGLYAR